MQKEQSLEPAGKKLEAIAAAILITICIVAVGYLVYINIDLDQTDTDGYTMSYSTIDIYAASELINNSRSGLLDNNLTIIDCRGKDGCSTCQFKNDGHLLGAVLQDKPESLYNTTDDLLVYSADGTWGEWLCNQLKDHVYGKIYNIEGGFKAWKDAGLELEYGA